LKTLFAFQRLINLHLQYIYLCIAFILPLVLRVSENKYQLKLNNKQLQKVHFHETVQIKDEWTLSSRPCGRTMTSDKEIASEL